MFSMAQEPLYGGVSMSGRAGRLFEVSAMGGGLRRNSVAGNVDQHMCWHSAVFWRWGLVYGRGSTWLGGGQRFIVGGCGAQPLQGPDRDGIVGAVSPPFPWETVRCSWA